MYLSVVNTDSNPVSVTIFFILTMWLTCLLFFVVRLLSYIKIFMYLYNEYNS